MPEVAVGVDEAGGGVGVRGFRGNGGRLVVSLVVVAAILVGVELLTSGQDRAGAFSAVNVTGASGPAPRIGSLAPDFEAPDLSGKAVRLSDFRGRPVWINFWATWCPPCRAEVPDIQAAYQEKQGDGLVLLAVDLGEDANAVRRYVEASGITYTVVLDSDGSIAARYRVNGLPTHVFVDRAGSVRGLQIGGLSKSAFLGRLAGILAPA